jgi:hypothetical protein
MGKRTTTDVSYRLGTTGEAEYVIKTPTHDGDMPLLIEREYGPFSAREMAAIVTVGAARLEEVRQLQDLRSAIQTGAPDGMVWKPDPMDSTGRWEVLCVKGMWPPIERRQRADWVGEQEEREWLPYVKPEGVMGPGWRFDTVEFSCPCGDTLVMSRLDELTCLRCLREYRTRGGMIEVKEPADAATDSE